MHAPRRRLVALGAPALLGLSLGLGLARPTPALAHAVLLASYPNAGIVLPVGPSSVHLWFSEPVQALPGAITVIGPTGRRADVGPVHNTGTELSVALHAQARGTYVVNWRVISYDTHPAAGRFVFSVGRAGGAASIARGASTSGALGLGLQVLARWLHAAGYALGFGALAFLLLAWTPAHGHDERAERRLLGLSTLGVILLLLAEPLALLGQTASLGTSAIFDPVLTGTVLASSFGRVLAQRLAAAVLLWVLIGVARQGARAALYGAVSLGVALTLADGQASHAVSSGPLWLGLALNTIHEAATGLWAGGIAALLAVWPLLSRDVAAGRGVDVSRGVLPWRFGRIAGAALVALSVTGLLMAVLHLRQPGDLLTTSYGRALAAKTLVVAVVVLLAWGGLRARPARRPRWWRLEAAALGGVLALAALLVSLPPPA